MFLYRALRPEEISRGVLIPKSREPFVAHPMLPQVLPFPLGERPEHAVRAQQWEREDRYPTSGVSTTPHRQRADYSRLPRCRVFPQGDYCGYFRAGERHHLTKRELHSDSANERTGKMLKW